jgi:soluble lytic murein transglycosylase-like protein
MIQFEKLGIFLSRPIAFLLVLIYFLQSGLLVYLIADKYDLEGQISFQQKRIRELEERIQILKAIDDFQIGFNQEEANKLGDVIYSESKKYGYDPMFVMAIILTESSFRNNQTSSAGALGLMQVVPYVGADVAARAGVNWSGSATLNEAESNIKVGTRYLFEQILKFGDVKKALVSYNMGETALRDLMRRGQPLPKQYLRSVEENYRMLKETYKV